MEKTFNDYVCIYKEQLEQGDIQKAYIRLVKYMLSLKSHLSKNTNNGFLFGNASPGYMDYTYFPFFNEFLRGRDLRFGLVLNHSKVRFELWLMGRNAEIQKKYWDILKTTKWNETQVSMPQYSVLEVILVEDPDFDNLKALSLNIDNDVMRNTKEIIEFLKFTKA